MAEATTTGIAAVGIASDMAAAVERMIMPVGSDITKPMGMTIRAANEGIRLA